MYRSAAEAVEAHIVLRRFAEQRARKESLRALYRGGFRNVYAEPPESIVNRLWAEVVAEETAGAPRS
jgi:hypothetical protein